MTFLFAAGRAFAADSGTPIQVHGDTVEYFHDEEKVVATGHVSIDQEGTKLTADKMTVYMKSKDAVAEGHVVLTQKGTVFSGDRGEYNFGTKIGKVEGMKGSIEPRLYGGATEIERVSEDHYRAHNSYITSCCSDNPFWKVQARDIDIFPGKKVVVRNALLFIKGIPVFFVPLYVQPLVDFDRFPVQLVPGSNSEWGPFLLSKWRYDLLDTPAIQSKGNLLLDYRVKRGIGAGAENYYKGDAVGRGAARVYTIRDQDAPPDGHTGSRYRAQWRHQARLTESTTLTTEINKLSDPEIVKDFFYYEEYQRDALPDNYVSLITSKPEYSLSILDRERLDDFYNVVERSPEIRFDTHTRRFAETPFYLRQEFQFANLKHQFADSKLEEDVLRFDVNQTLSYDASLGPVSVTPRVGTRQTYYSRRIDSSEDEVRGTFDPGLDLSTRFFKTYDWSNHALGLDWNGIRHIFTPTASYNFRPNPTVNRTVLAQFDALDAVDKRNFWRFNFENKIQTKEHVGPDLLQTREIARVIPFFDMDYDTHRLDNIGLDAELRPYPWLGLEGDVIYNNVVDRVETANGDIYFKRGDWEVGLGQRYLREESSQTTADLRWHISDEYQLHLYERFEFMENKSREFEATLTKVFECVIVDFTFNQREGSGESFFCVFRLKGYPKASFSMSQSYNHPKEPASTARL
ncbi:MAG TPA: LPS assembly protein LptD [Candidatus Eisenbacteria bacterium]|nr:LPS assembly protein LptD [Candidatus Eisenbacteria bacterium]